jgi:hypothetical protein
MTMAMAITLALTTPARLAKSERLDRPFKLAYSDYGYDFGYDHTSLNDSPSENERRV